MRQDESTNEPVDACTLNISVDNRVGCVHVDARRGQSIKERLEVYRQIGNIVGVVIVILVCVALWFLYSHWQERSLYQAHIDWLTDFYQKNAPQVRTRSLRSR